MKNTELLIEKGYFPIQTKKHFNITVLLAVLSFIIVLCIGSFYYGKSNFESVFYIVMSGYAALLGFLIAYNSLNKPSKSADNLLYHQMIKETSEKASLIYNLQTNKIEYCDSTIHTILGTTLRSLDDILFNSKIHPFDRSNLAGLLKFDLDHTFTYTVRKQTQKGIINWIKVDATKLSKQEEAYIVMHIIDVTSLKQQDLAQQQYLAEMENIVQQNQYPDNRMQQLAELITAHDMKEPLRTIKNYIQLIERRCKNKLDPNGLEMMKHVSDGAYRMTQMIDDIIASMGIDEDNLELEEVNLNLVMSEVIKDLETKIREANASIHYRSLPKVEADARQMKHLLLNLIENALKYRSEKTPEIFIDCEEDKNRWIFKIEDNGIGIAPKHQASIFTFFNRGEIKNGYKGMGLGLAISKKIVNNHDGDIWVFSAGKDQGSTFYFSLPSKNQAVLKTMAETTANAASMRAAY